MVTLHQKSFLNFVPSLEGAFKTSIEVLHYKTCVFYLTKRVTGFDVQNRRHFLMNCIKQPTCKAWKEEIFRSEPSISITCMLLYAVTRCVTLTFKAQRFLYLPAGLTFKNSTWCRLCVECGVWVSGEATNFALYNINWLVFITEMKSVYSAVRTGSLNKAVCASSLKG